MEFYFFFNIKTYCSFTDYEIKKLNIPIREIFVSALWYYINYIYICEKDDGWETGRQEGRQEHVALLTGRLIIFITNHLKLLDIESKKVII